MTVAFLSLFSSLAFIVLTYYDLRYLNPCCDKALKEFAEYTEQKEKEVEVAEIMGEDPSSIEVLSEREWMSEYGICTGGDPNCNDYYHNNRMPKIFELIDQPVCIIYATHYFLNLYIAVNRCHFFIERYNMTQLLFVIMPPLVLSWNTSNQASLILLAISRLYRLEKAMALMTIFIDTEESEVSAQVY